MLKVIFKRNVINLMEEDFPLKSLCLSSLYFCEGEMKFILEAFCHAEVLNLDFH